MPETVQEAYEEAKENGTCPVCPSCDKPLTKIRQTQYCYLTWVWDEDQKKYVKHEDGDAEPAYCDNCEAQDWGFVDEHLVHY
ncbi:hypothetical protein ACFLXE_00005 [Chloroflexota bacterium]